MKLCEHDQEPLVRRAVEEGIVPLNWQLAAVVAARGSVSQLCYLVSERGLDLNPRNAGRNVTITAFTNNTDRNALYSVNEAGMDVNGALSAEGKTLLMVAAEKGHVGVLKAPVAKGARVDAVTSDTHTAVGFAVWGRR